MKVLVLKNIPMEGPGTIEDYLKKQAIAFDTVELMEGGEPKDPTAGYSHLIMMGGPMAVYEMHMHKHLERGASLIDDFIKQKKPVLGVCLGAQMIAHVLGANVYAGGQKEVGWYEVDISPEGMEDGVFKTLSMEGAPKAEVFQWHGDTFDLPAGAVRLASSPVYANQAFRWGKSVYALQFHIEVTPPIITEWFAGERDFFETQKLFKKTLEVYPEYSKRAVEFYGEFFR
ncbi:MAG: gamma-glutamyl-gamma-aminobutyrate hydrolase family protein [Nitrospiraceae bacterium]|nr:gamma-glutamyl-gamma-aminobutyrate hydrolase family protein [Nitrospiraceae bacterium]